MLLALVVFALPGAGAQAGTIRGDVHFPAAERAHPSANAYPGSAASLPGSHMPERGRPSDAVVYLDGPSDSPPRNGPLPRLVQKD